MNLPTNSSRLESDRKGKLTQETSVQNETLDPVWDENFRVEFSTLADVLILEIWDHDVVRPNEPLGTAKVLSPQVSYRLVSFRLGHRPSWRCLWIRRDSSQLRWIFLRENIIR